MIRTLVRTITTVDLKTFNLKVFSGPQEDDFLRMTLKDL
jgi:hypothetical protein